MPLMSNVMCPRAEQSLPLARDAVGLLPVQRAGGAIARQAGSQCFMPVLSVNGERSSRKAAQARLFGSARALARRGLALRVPFERVCSGTRAGPVAG